MLPKDFWLGATLSLVTFCPEGRVAHSVQDECDHRVHFPNMSNPASTLAPSPVAGPRLSNERSKEELELAERLIEHSQGIQHAPPIVDRRTTPSTADGGSRSGGDVERLSDDGGSETSLSAQQQQLTPQHSHHQQQQNLQLPSIHELTWVKQRKPFNTGMGGAGQVCRYFVSIHHLTFTC